MPRQLKSVESKLSMGLQEHQKLMQYTQEYKVRSLEKVRMLMTMHRHNTGLDSNDSVATHYTIGWHIEGKHKKSR